MGSLHDELMIPKVKAQGHKEEAISCKASQKNPSKNSPKIEEKKGSTV
jgi:hypothetical protein